MIGKILISSALIISLMFLVSQIENSKSTIKEAKDIQEHYEIIKEIKTLIALRYNLDPESITRDDIIAHLPKGENWEKILLLDRQKSSSLSNKEFVNSEANIVISEDEKIKVLALKAKLKSSIDSSSLVGKNGVLEIPVALEKKSLFSLDIDFNKRVDRAVSYLTNEILYCGEDAKDALDVVLTKDKFFDFSLKYTNKDTESIDDKQKEIKKTLKLVLEKQDNSQKMQLYKKLKEELEK